MALAFYFKSHRENQGESMGEKLLKKCSLSTGMTRQPSMLSPGS